MAREHLFALYIPDLAQSIAGDDLIFNQKEVCHRISQVLRMKSGDMLIVFDGIQTIDIQLHQVSKQRVVGSILKHQLARRYKPLITFFLPLLKRSALEDTIYGLVEVGVNIIQLVSTEKSARWHMNDLARLQRIVIAACEQAKQFNIPELKAPMAFVDIPPSESFIFFDPQGASADECLKQVKQLNSKQISLLIGPEGDLTKQEKDQVTQMGILTCKLTPTILRAKQAAILGAGIIRSFMR